MNTNNQIDLIPAGHGLSFTMLRAEVKPVEDLYNLLKKPEIGADLEKLKPGFFKVDKYQDCCMASFAYPLKEEKEVLREGVIRKMELPICHFARVILVPGRIYLSGATDAGKAAVSMINTYLSISGEKIKPGQEKLISISTLAGVVKAIKFANIPHSEVEQASFSGELEEIYADSLPLREAEIKSVRGAFMTEHGMREVAFSAAGKVDIRKSKRLPICLKLIQYCANMIE